MSSKLLPRIVSAVILGPIFLAMVVYGWWTFIIALVLAFTISVVEWFGLSRKTGYFLPTFPLGLIYITLSFLSFFSLREVFSVNVLLVFIGMIWSSDIGAYFTGKTIGGPKLIQRISPNKTWSGFGGAMFFPAIFAVFWVGIIGLHTEFDENSFWIMGPVAVILGLMMGIVGQAGDLLVSFVKRRAQVKDTGTLIPGHGGLLDRIDSMLLAAPVFFLTLTLMSYVI